MVSAELSKEGSSSQRKYTCDVHARRRMSRRVCSHGIPLRDICDECMERIYDNRPRCPHFFHEGHCARCLRQCEHGNGKETCRQCNRCPHNEYKKLCKYCNKWTCEVDGCLYKGHRFCSKASLKHHTSRICPSQAPVFVDGQWVKAGKVFVDGQWVKAGNSSQHSQESVAETPVPVRVLDPMFRFIRKATAHKTG